MNVTILFVKMVSGFEDICIRFLKVNFAHLLEKKNGSVIDLAKNKRK